MNRRGLLASSIALSAWRGSKVFGSQAASEGSQPSSREFYELRIYHLRRGPQQKLMDEFLERAALPALKRAQVGPVGVFHIMIGPASPSVYVLITHPSLESFATLERRLGDDEEFQRSAAAFVNAPATDPAYVRVESSLMLAFESLPHLEVPPAAAKHQGRIFELRTYESHSKRANRKKIEMFDKWEIAIFRRTGLRPVFFGETLAGANLPNLTYLLTFDDMASRDKAWATFIGDPEWKRISSMPGFTDPEIVSNITNVLLSPAPYSEI
jgi:hypothetical protein